VVITYAELDAASARVAATLRARGLNPGDRVGIMLPNVPQFAVVYYGVLRAGGVVVPMNVLLEQREVAFYLAIRRRACCSRGTSSPAPVAARAGDETAVILYTSGTTGKPKGAELTHAGLARNVDALLAEIMFGLEPGTWCSAPCPCSTRSASATTHATMSHRTTRAR